MFIGGKLVKSIDLIQENDIINFELSDGVVESKVICKEKRDVIR